MRLRRAGDRWWHVAGTLLALLAIAVAAAGLCLHTVGTSRQLLVLLTAVAHQLMWAAPIALLLAVAVRRWLVAVVACIACVMVAVVQLPSAGIRGQLPGRHLVVLQANLKIGSADAAALTELVRNQHVDVLATEELTDREQAALIAAGLPRLLGHRYTAPLPEGGGGLGIWSRFPLTDTHNLDGYSAGVLTARLHVRGRLVTFVALHLSPPYRQPFATWRTEIANLRGTLAGLPEDAPVVAAGDFNATVDHAQFRALLTGGYQDAAEQSGAGYLPTYPNDHWWGPVIGIDHVLTRGRALATSVDTFTVPRSDHRALLVHVALG